MGSQCQARGVSANGTGGVARLLPGGCGATGTRSRRQVATDSAANWHFPSSQLAVRARRYPRSGAPDGARSSGNAATPATTASTSAGGPPSTAPARAAPAIAPVDLGVQPADRGDRERDQRERDDGEHGVRRGRGAHGRDRARAPRRRRSGRSRPAAARRAARAGASPIARVHSGVTQEASTGDRERGGDPGHRDQHACGDRRRRRRAGRRRRRARASRTAAGTGRRMKMPTNANTSAKPDAPSRPRTTRSAIGVPACRSAVVWHLRMPDHHAQSPRPRHRHRRPAAGAVRTRSPTSPACASATRR